MLGFGGGPLQPLMNFCMGIWHVYSMCSAAFFNSPRGRWVIHAMCELMFIIIFQVLVRSTPFLFICFTIVSAWRTNYQILCTCGNVQATLTNHTHIIFTQTGVISHKSVRTPHLDSHLSTICDRKFCRHASFHLSQVWDNLSPEVSGWVLQTLLILTLTDLLVLFAHYVGMWRRERIWSTLLQTSIFLGLSPP